jgi:SAM-dependent methyltransferase
MRGAAVASGQAVKYVFIFPLRLTMDFVVDKWLGVETRGNVHHEATLRSKAIGGDPVIYQPLRLRMWQRLMAAVPLDPTESTFVDLGSGRGRALFFAARAGFRRVIGVELDEILARHAAANVERWTERRPSRVPGQEIQALQGDAAVFVPPKAPLLLFLFNPFGPDTMGRVLTTLTNAPFGPEDSVFVAYQNPLHADVFDAFPQLELHVRRHELLVYRLVP